MKETPSTQPNAQDCGGTRNQLSLEGTRQLFKELMFGFCHRFWSNITEKT